jgi:hypothetical protein
VSPRPLSVKSIPASQSAVRRVAAGALGTAISNTASASNATVSVGAPGRDKPAPAQIWAYGSLNTHRPLSMSLPST